MAAGQRVSLKKKAASTHPVRPSGVDIKVAHSDVDKAAASRRVRKATSAGRSPKLPAASVRVMSRPIVPIREIVRRRWQSAWPFEGFSTEAIERKLAAEVLTPEARDHAMRERARRK
ncbi:hypothetical protein ACIQW5_26840 [Methylorubrum thiocyanatum]|jgi:hypothetical protein|uniref:hypothetical protein n=1 Tax=Methylorubrum thiocyanatum TaxID=47958 RepID=UPI00383BD60B